MRSKVIECKNEKICTTVTHFYLFIRKHISFQANFCMLIVYKSEKHRESFL